MGAGDAGFMAMAMAMAASNNFSYKSRKKTGFWWGQGSFPLFSNIPLGLSFFHSFSLSFFPPIYIDSMLYMLLLDMSITVHDIRIRPV